MNIKKFDKLIDDLIDNYLMQSDSFNEKLEKLIYSNKKLKFSKQEWNDYLTPVFEKEDAFPWENGSECEVTSFIIDFKLDTYDACNSINNDFTIVIRLKERLSEFKQMLSYS